jgi:MSHA biogenesis protein MshM
MIYLDHFGLDESPFGITPDTGFIYASPAHQEALATVQLAVRSGEGFVKVTGEVGTGKTLLCRALLLAFQATPETVTAYVPNPRLTPREMLRVLATELGLSFNRRSASRDIYEIVETGLMQLAQAGRNVVLCIDEAQAMPIETLESLRLLSNIETGKRKLLQVVLFGQPELDAVLSLPECRSLASRIAFSARLLPLSDGDFRHYLQHRLRIAGWRGPDVFTPLARWLLRWASGGVPRRANILAHKGLMLAYGDGVHRVGLGHAWAAARDGRLRPPAHAANAPASAMTFGAQR